MKVSARTNLAIVTALVATLSVLAACGPQKKTSKFMPRGSNSRPNGTAEDRAAAEIFGSALNNEQSRELAQKIAKVELQIIDAQPEDRSELESLKADLGGTTESTEQANSDAEERGSEAPAQSQTGAVRTERNATNGPLPTIQLFKAEITIVGVGKVKFVGISSAESRKTVLEATTSACRTSVQLKVKTACLDNACNRVGLEISDKTQRDAKIRFSVAKSASNTQGDLREFSYEAADQTAALTQAGAEVSSEQAECEASATANAGAGVGAATGNSSGNTGVQTGNSSGNAGVQTGNSSGNTGVQTGNASGNTGVQAGNASGNEGIDFGGE
jgi:hypothetical protein